MSTMCDIGKQEVNESISCLRSITKLAKKSSEFAKSIKQQLKDEAPEDGSKGISFLELKNHIMLTYLMNLNQLMMTKCNGESIEHSVFTDRLIEYRTILEKMRPIQHKLKYQIDKAINQSRRTSAVDPTLMLKPNVSNLMDDDDLDEEEHLDEQVSSEKTLETNNKRPQAYIVPKINPVEYEYETRERMAKAEEKLEKAKKRAASTALVREFAAQFDDDGAPEEVNEMSVGQRRSLKQREEKTRFEEEYFVRLHDKKKKPNSDQQNLLTMNTLGDSLTHFQNISALNVDDAEEFAEMTKSSKKNKDRVKMPKKIAKKLAKRSAKRSMRKRLRL